jgi:hypothetical protein
MNDDVRKTIYNALIIFILVLVTWIGFLYVNSCGFTLTCNRGKFPVARTPIPTLLPATLPAIKTGDGVVVVSDQCQVAAVDFIGAWVSAGSSETESFQFTDGTGRNCESSFQEVKPLFTEANFWYSGSLSCVSCHSVDVTISPAQLDLSSYAGIKAGSRRPDAESEGTDILGAGNWDGSLLHEFLSTSKADIPGHAEIATDLVIFVGKPLPAPEATATPVPTEVPTITPTP